MQQRSGRGTLNSNSHSIDSDHHVPGSSESLLRNLCAVITHALPATDHITSKPSSSMTPIPLAHGCLSSHPPSTVQHTHSAIHYRTEPYRLKPNQETPRLKTYPHSNTSPKIESTFTCPCRLGRCGGSTYKKEPHTHTPSFQLQLQSVNPSWPLGHSAIFFLRLKTFERLFWI